MKHRLSWFTKRIGKVIYRNRLLCDDGQCESCWHNEVKIHSKEHASYLELVQNELDIDYFDKPVKI